MCAAAAPDRRGRPEAATAHALRHQRSVMLTPRPGCAPPRLRGAQRSTRAVRSCGDGGAHSRTGGRGGGADCAGGRSGEGRVGEEGRSWVVPDQLKKKKQDREIL